ncbi:MAG: hypothetical protein IPM24_12270 [Bryobacterales bacterium]|nr:hypothetical protein [Bryobacterales bacterium]
MPLTDVFLALGEDSFRRLVRGISIGKLKTYQLYDRMKARTHLAKLSSETLQRASGRLWTRLSERDEELAQDLSQAILIARFDMIVAILDFLGIPHDDGFFAKDMDPAPYLTDGWRDRVLDQFREQYDEAFLRLYIGHLEWELAGEKDAAG